MTLFLKNGDPANNYFGETYDGEKIYKTQAPTIVEELIDTVGNGSIAQPMGKNVKFVVDHRSEQRRYRTKRMFLQGKFANASATESPTFKHAFGFIDHIKCKADGVDLPDISRMQIYQIIDEHLARQLVSERVIWLSRTRTESTDTFAGETIPVSSTLYFSLDLLLLYDYLQDYVNLGPIRVLEFVVYFAIDNNSAPTMGLFVSSNTTSNALATASISITDLQLKRVIETNNDPVLDVIPRDLKLLDHAWIEGSVDGLTSWTTVGTDKVTIDLNTKFLPYNRILGLKVLIQSPSMVTAFNDADACQFYSGPKYIGFQVLQNNKNMVDYRGADKLHERKRYMVDFYKRRYGTTPSMSLVNDSDNWSRYYQWGTYIDFSNLKVEGTDDYAVSGVSNALKEWTVQLTCESSIHASCNILLFLHCTHIVDFPNGKIAYHG